MGDHDHGHTLGVQPAQELHNIGVMSEILARRRLVQNDKLGVLHQHAGDGHALFLAEAQRRDGPVAERVQAADLQRVLDPGANLSIGQAAALQAQRDLVKDHRLGDHLVRVLHDIADMPGTAADVFVFQVFSVKENFTAVGRLKAADQLGER